MTGCDDILQNLFWSFVGLVFGTGLGFSLGYRTGKKRR